MDALSDVRVEERGTPEHVWRPYLRNTPTVGSAASLVPPGRRLVIVAPHPDDETLATGGLIAELSSLGRAFLLIAVTDGEASHEKSPAWPARDLAARRALEQANALQLLGAREVMVIRAGIPDGEVGKRRDDLERLLHRHLSACDVVFSPLPNDGHPDHDATGQATRAVSSARGATSFAVPVWMWHWATPGDTRIPWERMIEVELSAAAVARKRQAIACYRTQLEGDASTGAPPVLSKSVQRRFARPYETVFQ